MIVARGIYNGNNITSDIEKVRQVIEKVRQVVETSVTLHRLLPVPWVSLQERKEKSSQYLISCQFQEAF